MLRTIRNRFLVLFILLITVTIILIGIMSDYIIQKQITRSVTDSFLDDLNGEITKVESFFNMVKSDIDILAGETTSKTENSHINLNNIELRHQLEDIFIWYMEVRRIYSEITYFDYSGKEIVSVNFNGDRASISKDAVRDEDTEEFIDAMKLNKGVLYVSPLYLNRKHGKIKAPMEPVIRYAKYVFNETGDKTGILIINVLGEKFLEKLSHVDQGNLMLVNKEGYFLIHPDESLEFGFDVSGNENERLQKYYPDHAGRILAGGSGYVDTGRGWVTTWLYWFSNPGDELVVYKSIFPNPVDKTNYWLLIRSGNKKELIGTLMTIRGIMLGISIVFFAITCPVILFFGLRITNSVSRLKNAMDGFEKGEGIKELDINANDEFSELNRSLVTMSESLYCTKMSLNTEVRRLKNLMQFSRLVGEEISEKDCYSILIIFLSKNCYLDKIVVVSFNNSENIAEILLTYDSKDGELPVGASSQSHLKVINNVRLCRALRSGRKFIVRDVESDYRCPYEEVSQDKGSYACFPVITGSAVLGWIHLSNYNKDHFTEELCFTIESYINTMAPAINSIRLLNTHRKMSILDPLTGLYNRRFLEEVLERQIAIAERYEQSLSVIMIDIDHFKTFNDSHGHAFGDNALKLVSKIILMTVREADTVARYGGEEFIVVLPNTELNVTCILAEKLRAAIEQCTITNNNGISEGVTISLGVSSYPSIAYTMEELIESSDNALYQSKMKGRNMVTSAKRDMGPIDELSHNKRVQA
jgi:diguanylate cyclase (GGDEF)-like protein